jgi:hypothetical protein
MIVTRIAVRARRHGCRSEQAATSVVVIRECRDEDNEQRSNWFDTVILTALENRAACRKSGEHEFFLSLVFL